MQGSDSVNSINVNAHWHRVATNYRFLVLGVEQIFWMPFQFPFT